MTDDKKQFPREPLNRPIQRTLALSLERAMAASDLSPEQREQLIREMSYQISLHSNSTNGFDSFFKVEEGKDEEERREITARKSLVSALETFFLEVRDIVQSQINDKIRVSDVVDGVTIAKTGEVVPPEKMAKLISLGWVRKILFETYADDFDEKLVAQEFDNTYYQIVAQKIGPEDFSIKAKPYGK